MRAPGSRGCPAVRAARARRPPNAPSCALPRSARSSALIVSQLVSTCSTPSTLDLAEDVRVAAHDLGGDRPIHVGQVEGALLRGELRVEDDLEQQVAELLGEVRRRAVLDGVDRLVGLLEQVRAQGEVRLLPIPWAAVGRAQAGADGGHAVRAGEVLQGIERRDQPVRRRPARRRRGRPGRAAADPAARAARDRPGRGRRARPAHRGARGAREGRPRPSLLSVRRG